MYAHRHHTLPKLKQQTEFKKAALPVIAPRYHISSDPNANIDPLALASINLPRSRLPPRSRFGCWTCRTRKVKCDEARPECNPCSRLGHTCDYNPRLLFKDDTSRVVEKLSGKRGGVGPAWKPSTTPFKRQRLALNQEDLLPPFASLTNDDNRERKAEFKPAGTYNIVVNPKSFVDFEEYRETLQDNNLALPPQGYGGPYPTPIRQVVRAMSEEDLDRNQYDAENVNDPDVVVLKVFEDDNQKSVSLGDSHLPRKGRYPLTPTLSSTSGPGTDIFRSSKDNTALMRYAHHDGRDHQIIHYYKTFVHRHLAQVHRDSLGTTLETGALSAPDIFERQAGHFLPLYHALMAFSALSMSHKHGIPTLAALQHYQQALPSLKASLQTKEDLASDGVFLTHFILLLYEIAAGEPRGLSLWSQHISQLQRIVLLRRDMHGPEPYNFIVWWVACIDIHVVLSGMGDGEYVKTMLCRRLLPTGIGSDSHYTPMRGLPTETDNGALPSSLSFHRRICVLAAELGLLSKELRNEAKRLMPHPPSPETIQNWQTRIMVLQDTFRRTWNVQMPASVASGYCNQLLPVGARGIFEHSFALYRALIIYSHTSMYPTQRLHNPSHTIHEVSRSAGEILCLGREIVASGHVERKFIVFPLVMAAFVNKSPTEREEIVQLIRKMEEDSVGRNVVAARHLLETVYERQDRRREELNEQRRRKGMGKSQRWEVVVEDVDWVGMIGELGLQVVNARL
ncbi:MAG: hypothetical protein Q9217_004095 [Psora testacea]